MDPNKQKQHIAVYSEHGFAYRESEVRILTTEDKYGIWFEVNTPRQQLSIRVTPTGFIRVGEVYKKYRPRPELEKKENEDEL